MKVCTMDVREGETFSRRPFFPTKLFPPSTNTYRVLCFSSSTISFSVEFSAVFPFCQRIGRKEVNFWGSTSLSRNAHGLTELVRVSLCMQLDLTTFTSCIPPRLFNCVRPWTHIERKIRGENNNSFQETCYFKWLPTINLNGALTTRTTWAKNLSTSISQDDNHSGWGGTHSIPSISVFFGLPEENRRNH